MHTSNKELETLQYLIAEYFPTKDATQALAVLNRLTAVQRESAGLRSTETAPKDGTEILLAAHSPQHTSYARQGENTNTPKLPPLPDTLDKTIHEFARAALYYEREGRIAATNQLKKAIETYAIAAIEAQGVPDWWLDVLDNFEKKERSPFLAYLAAGLVNELRTAMLASAPPAPQAGSPNRPSTDWYKAKIMETLDDDFNIGPAPQATRCELCQYQHGHQIGCANNPVDIALKAQAQQWPFPGWEVPKATVVQQEPVMIYHGDCVIDCGEHGHHHVELLKMIPAGSLLYTHPAQQAKQQPLSDKEADRMTERFYLNGRPVPALYRLSLVRATERHYGIKE